MTGRQEIWATLKMVVGLIAEGDTQTAQGIINASGITLPTGDLINGAYDESGNLYQMPEQIIADPINLSPLEKSAKPEIQAAKPDDTDEEELERRREEKGKAVLKSGDTVRVKARLSDRGGPDVVINLAKDHTIRILIRRIHDEAGVRSNYQIPDFTL